MKLCGMSEEPSKKKISSLDNIKPLIKKTNIGSAKDAEEKFISDHGQTPDELQMGIIPIGKYHHIVGCKRTLFADVKEIINELEFGVLNGMTVGGKHTQFWEKSNSLYQIQVAILNWFKTTQVDLDMVTMMRTHIAFNILEEILPGEPLLNTQFKYDNKNRYYCNDCKQRRNKEFCNRSAQLWIWNGELCVRIEGEHEPGHE